MESSNNNITINPSTFTFQNVAEVAVSYPDMDITGCLNPFNKNNKMITKNVVQNILKKYGVYQNINNLMFYQEAMIHESYTIGKINEVCIRDNVKVVANPDGCVLLQLKSYERLEFLGDAILDNVIVSYLFNRFPDQTEGFLSGMKINFVNRIILAKLAKLIGLDEYLIISKTLDDIQKSRDDIKILCDIFEAFIAAIYLDFNDSKPGLLHSFMSGIGYQVAETFIINLIEDEESKIDITEFILNDSNYKDQLIKYLKRTNKINSPIEFKIIKTNGIGSKKEITINIIHKLNGITNIIGKGIGNTQKNAEQIASADALRNLGILKNH